ncbi:MAG TPA: sigma-70 family RNA polymerase sigma factor [Caulobacteraceae bacterium]|nr:sigma-70 family RNA polymerase sigma factor [Caulobacteraceae bacterium]
MPPPTKKVVAEDAAALAEAVNGWSAQYGPALRRYFLKKVGANEADDLVQEVFLSLQVRGSTGGEIDNIEGYLFRTAANAIVRRHQRQKWDWAGHDVLFDDLDDLSDDVSPERVLMGKEELDRVLEAMRSLPPRCSQAFFLHRFEELTYSAIAARMRISNKAVERLIQRALRRLSLTLDGEL